MWNIDVPKICYYVVWFLVHFDLIWPGPETALIFVDRSSTRPSPPSFSVDQFDLSWDPGQVRSGQVTPGQVRSGQVRLDQVKLGEIDSDGGS